MSRASLIRLVLLACIWGSSFLLIKLSLEGLAPMQVVLGRLLAAAAVLLAIVVLRRQRLPSDPAIWAHLALMGVVANIVPFFLFAWGEQRITSGLAGILNGTTPLFTLGFAVAALRVERLTAPRLVGLFAGFSGVVLVVGPWDVNPLTSSLPGQLACLLAAACYGLAFVYTRRFLSTRGYSPLALATGQMCCAALTASVVTALVAPQPPDLTGLVVASTVVLGAVGTGLAYLLFYRLITDEGATTASIVTYLVPIVAVMVGAVFLQEPVGWNLFAGTAVVIAGVAVAEGRLAVPGIPRPTTGPPESTVDMPVVGEP